MPLDTRVEERFGNYGDQPASPVRYFLVFEQRLIRRIQLRELQLLAFSLSKLSQVHELMSVQNRFNRSATR